MAVSCKRGVNYNITKGKEKKQKEKRKDSFSFKWLYDCFEAIRDVTGLCDVTGGSPRVLTNAQHRLKTFPRRNIIKAFLFAFVFVVEMKKNG